MHPFVSLMKRYVVEYLLCQNASVCAQIMEPDYVLHMADIDLTPRDEVYVPAVVSQFGLFPGMGMTVHDLCVCGDRIAMRFSQHGASTGHQGRLASWTGIGLYRWNGNRLTDTYAIEDYESRRIQLASGVSRSVEPPMVAPWDMQEERRDAALEEMVRALIVDRSIWRLPGVWVDDELPGQCAPIVEGSEVHIDDLFSAGSSVAFKATFRGTYAGGLDVPPDHVGIPLTIHATGLVRVAMPSAVITGHIVRGRGPARRALLQR
jgi:hypothetical protein